MNDDASHYSSGYNSVGQASYAVAMANDAIDNARRAAAESRNRRSYASNTNDDAMQPRHQQRQPPPKPLPSDTPQTPRRDPIPGTAEFVRNDRAESMAAKITRNLSQRRHHQQQQQQQQQQKQSQQKQPQTSQHASSPLLPAGTEDLDLKTNDNAYHVIGTLLTDRLLPKLDAHPGCTHYSLDQDDVDFFNGMLPYSVRRRFVDALRYRLQLIKSGGRMGTAGGKDLHLGDAALRRLTMQCQLLGLERMHQNVLLDLAQSVGKSYPINLKDQGPLAFGAAANDTQQQHHQQQQPPPHQQRNVSFGLVPFAAGASPTSHGGIHDTFSSGTAGAGIWNTTAADDADDCDATDPTLRALAMIDRSTSYEATAESLARQQIMAEIHETKLLMKGSVTPEATQFWKKHLDELSQRLVILSLEEQMSKVGQDGSDPERGSGGDGDWDGEVDRSTRDRGTNNDVMYAKVKQHYGPPNGPSQAEYLENNHYGNAANHYGNNYNDGSYQPPVHHVVDAQVVFPSDGTVQSNAHGSVHNVHSHHTNGNNNVGSNFHSDSSTFPNEPLKSSLRPGGKRELEELPVCDVVAPSDLPGGYMFEAQLGTKKFLATVPQGGVTKGQRFVSTMRELETIEIPVPLGAWRDEAHECCNDGVFHPLFLNTLFFPCIALGQIMTRNGLDWQGDPANKLVSSTSCANMTVILTFWLAMNLSAFFMLRVQWERGYLVGAEHFVPIVLFNLFVLIYIMNLTRVVRESIRNKYQIPEERCLGCEDCVCATFCMPCTICQMGRHTADFDTYRGTCCTKTGLPRQVELAPVTFYEDQYENADQTHIV